MTTVERNRRKGVRVSDIGRAVDKIMDAPNIEDLELLLSETAQKIYNLGQKFITPRSGWVLVRQIEDRTELNGIIIPDKKQSQALSEGIVLSHTVDHCQFEVGDRILFNRWDGIPAPFLDAKKYRLIHEKELQGANSGVLGKIHYAPDDELKDKLEKLFANLKPVHETLFRGKSE